MKKVLIILCICIICLCVTLVCDKVEQPYSKADFIKYIKYDTSRSYVEKIFGEHDIKLSGSSYIVGYTLNDGMVIRINYSKGDAVNSMFLDDSSGELTEELLPWRTKVKKPYDKADFIEHVKYDMNGIEVLEIFGEPDMELGSGSYITGYQLGDYTIVGINYGGRGTVKAMFLLNSDEEFIETLLPPQ